MENKNQILPNFLITGTPGTGKTTFSQLLTNFINTQLQNINPNLKMTHVELSKLITDQKLYSEWDYENNCSIFDEDKVLDYLEQYIPYGGYIIDFHGSDFFPERYFDLVVVLRCENSILYERLQQRQYSQTKIENNIDCEIFQECLQEALESYKKEIIIELFNNTEQDMNININKKSLKNIFNNQLMQKYSMEQFEIKHLLGEGLMGKVFQVEHIQSKQIYALKQINKSFVTQINKVHHVYIEKYLLQNIHHKLIVKLHDTFQDDNFLYLLMEFLENNSLADYFENREKLELNEIRYIIAQIISSLEYLHQQGIIHRDIKPQNLIFSKQGYLKLIDFGSADIVEQLNNQQLFQEFNNIKKLYKEQTIKQLNQNDNELLQAKSFIGTPLFVCPEMINDNESFFSSDFWALGVILYRLAYGKYPFNQQNEYFIYQQINAKKIQFKEKIDPDLEDLIKKLLKFDHNKRLGSQLSQKTSIQAIKNHAFFNNKFDKFLLSNQEFLDHFQKERKTFIEPQDIIKKQSKKFLRVGMVRKYKYYFLYNTRQLMLTAEGNLEYYNPFNGSLRGTIKIKNDVEIISYHEIYLKVKTSYRTFTFRCLEGDAQDWERDLQSVKQQF